MTAAWRATVPNCPVGGSFREQPQPAVARVNPEVGEPIARRRSTFTPVSASMTLSLTVAEKAEFDAMFDDDFGGGALPFTMPYPAGGATKTWMFAEAPDATFAAPRWTVNLSLIRLD